MLKEVDYSAKEFFNLKLLDNLIIENFNLNY